MLTRLGEAGGDAFTIMRIAGHCRVSVSQRYVLPTPEDIERTFERLEKLNAAKYAQAEAEAKAEGAEMQKVGTNLGTVKIAIPPNPSQIVESKSGRVAQLAEQVTLNH